MPDPHETHEGMPGASDEALFDLVDRYVEARVSDRPHVRAELLGERPELAELLACLDTLASMAPPAPDGTSPQPEGAGSADTPTATRAGDSRRGTQGPATATAVRRFGKYELLAELGRGGMGVVYHARQEDLDRCVALKMILASHLASTDEVRRFYDEARAAAGLNHHGIVAIHEVGQIHGQHYFTMDYVDGRSLAAVLRDGPLAPETAATHLLAVARAVDYLHAHGIVHRDLKPSNILLGQDGQPHVADFGLAKVFSAGSQHTTTGTIIGTPPYMSPEQAAGRTEDVSPSSDIYSLGAILYAMLTGRPPVEEGNLLDMLLQVREGEPTPPCRLNRRIPRALEQICLRCLEKKPHDRYASAAAVADDLDRFLKGEPVEATPMSISHCLPRWARRHPVLASHLGGLLVAAAILQVTYLVRGVDLVYHLQIMTLFAVWGVVSVGFESALRARRSADLARFAWAAADVLLLTTLLLLADPLSGTLLIGYPLLIAASGLFFRVRLVWFMTGVTLVAYGTLMVLRPEMHGPPQYPLIYAAVLAVLGVIVTYQVHRVRALTRYYEARRLP